MTSYFVRRLMLVPITFVAITFITYAIQRLAPGGPIEQAMLQMRGSTGESGRGGGGGLTGEELALPQAALDQLKKYYKLDKPIWQGYLIWLGAWPDEDRGGRFHGILQGEFGSSYRYSEPVLSTITSVFPVSLYFGLIGYIASWLVCIPLGIVKALKHRTPLDTATSVAVFLGYAIPGFVVALLLSPCCSSSRSRRTTWE
jgi:microcin C transport system permease protein